MQGAGGEFALQVLSGAEEAVWEAWDVDSALPRRRSSQRALCPAGRGRQAESKDFVLGGQRPLLGPAVAGSEALR